MPLARNGNPRLIVGFDVRQHIYIYVYIYIYNIYIYNIYIYIYIQRIHACRPYLKDLQKHKPANKSSPSLLKWLRPSGSILITSGCHSEISDMELGQYRSRSGRSMDTTKSSNGSRPVCVRLIFSLVWTQTGL